MTVWNRRKNSVDITGNPQHGSKQTATVSLMIQTHTLDNNNYSKMASLDLSAPFNVVNIEVLLQRLKILGLPYTVINQIQIWLKNRLLI